jgi:hypothetical protein
MRSGGQSNALAEAIGYFKQGGDLSDEATFRITCGAGAYTVPNQSLLTISLQG